MAEPVYAMQTAVAVVTEKMAKLDAMSGTYNALLQSSLAQMADIKMSDVKQPTILPAPATAIALPFGAWGLLRLRFVLGTASQEGVHISDELAGEGGIVVRGAASACWLLLRSRFPLLRSGFRLTLRTAAL